MVAGLMGTVGLTLAGCQQADPAKLADAEAKLSACQGNLTTSKQETDKLRADLATANAKLAAMPSTPVAPAAPVPPSAAPAVTPAKAPATAVKKGAEKLPTTPQANSSEQPGSKGNGIPAPKKRIDRF